MKNNYLDDQLTMKDIQIECHDDLQALNRLLTRKRLVKETYLGSIYFDSPYSVSLSGKSGELRVLTKTGLESARAICKIPRSYQALISPELLTKNLNIRLRETDPLGNKKICAVSQDEGKSIDGFIPYQNHYLFPKQWTTIIREILQQSEDRFDVKIKRNRGYDSIKIIFPDEYEIQKEDTIRTGVHLQVPWVIGSSVVLSRFYERLVCSNGMVRVDSKHIEKFTMSHHPNKYLPELRTFMHIATQTDKKEIVPFINMAKMQIDEAEMEFIKKTLLTDFDSIKNFHSGTFWDMYNVLTQEAEKTPGMHGIEKMKKTGKLIPLFENQQNVEERIWQFFKIA